MLVLIPDAPCMPYMPTLTPQTTPTDRHIYHTWSVWVYHILRNPWRDPPDPSDARCSPPPDVHRSGEPPVGCVQATGALGCARLHARREQQEEHCTPHDLRHVERVLAGKNNHPCRLQFVAPQNGMTGRFFKWNVTDFAIQRHTLFDQSRSPTQFQRVTNGHCMSP